LNGMTATKANELKVTMERLKMERDRIDQKVEYLREELEDFMGPEPPVNGIKRYAISIFGGCEADGGDWVKYEDHKKLVKKLISMIHQNYCEDDELEFIKELENEIDK